MIEPFVVRMPSQILFGRGSGRDLGALAGGLGERAVVCTDGAIAASPILAPIVASLETHGVKCEIFSGGVPDPPIDTVLDAVAFARSADAEVIVGVGGGSSIDLAKLTALLLRFPAEISEYYGENRVPGPTVPVIAVPTTAGTGSEVSPVAVITDSSLGTKTGISSRHLIPRYAVCDPELTHGCPRDTTAHSGIDALTHALEAFTAKPRQGGLKVVVDQIFIGKNPFSDEYARYAIRNIGENLRRAVSDGADADAREGMLAGSLAAGIAFSHAGTAAAHALQYPIGAFTQTPHGLGVGMLLPYVLEFNLPACEAELVEVARLWNLNGGDDPGTAPHDVISEVEQLCVAIGLPRTLADIGLSRAELPEIAEQALRITRLIRNNPRSLDAPLLTAILEAAWYGERERIAETTRRSLDHHGTT